MWKHRGVDLDLWVSPGPKAKELYFNRQVTADGKYFHDYRNANVDLDYEYVELAPHVDIDQVRAWINFYDGSVRAPAEGLVVVHHNGRTYHGNFTIPARDGNRAKDKAKRQNSLYWIEINLNRLLQGDGNQNSP